MEDIHLMGALVNSGMVWNQLQDEREEVCQQMINSSMNSGTALKSQRSRLELMQSRLIEIDDALDRLASGVFGYCKSCGNELDEARLESNASVAECSACEQVKKQASKTDVTNGSADGLAISTCHAFDVIHIQTSHSSYRVLLIDPSSGRSLVEGGKFFTEPTEGTILGSSTRNAAFRSGWIGIGFRLEMWAADQLISTSAVSSVRVERLISEELRSEVSALYC
jgi:RNA polymerase-binding transcription factor DksA